MAFRPYVSTGIAFVSAAAIVAATPVVMPAQDGAARAAATVPAKVNSLTVDYELQAVTLQGISDAFFNGYGGFTNPPDEVFVPFAPGVVYYIGDQTLFSGTLVDNYFFELGAPAAAQYVASQLVGSNPVGQLIVSLVFDPFGTITGAIISLSAAFGPRVMGPSNPASGQSSRSSSTVSPARFRSPPLTQRL
jgi:hypothetical protein